jgi:glycosyltransferase involved in cell wall biosynthesis
VIPRAPSSSACRPTVSVIIPTYNRARLLGEAIRSVLEQTFGDFELIVVDDGSEDESRSVVRRIDDPRLRYLERPHRGISAAMNAGLDEARGELVARLDSDDVWLPALLERTVAALRAHPEYGVVYARGQAVDLERGLLLATRGAAPRFPQSHLASLLYDDFTCNIAVLVRRPVLDAAGPYDESLPYNEDWDLWIRVARHARFLFLDEVLARFRYHQDNITRRHCLEATLERVRVLDKAFGRPDLPVEVLALRARCYSNLHQETALRLFGLGRYRESFAHLRRSVDAGVHPVPALLRFAWRAALWRYVGRAALARHLARLNRRWQAGAAAERG